MDKYLKHPSQLSKIDPNKKQYIYKCRVSGDEYATLAYNENDGYFKGPAKMGWTREPNPDIDPNDPSVLFKYIYYKPGCRPNAKAVNVQLVKKLPKGLK